MTMVRTNMKAVSLTS